MIDFGDKRPLEYEFLDAGWYEVLQDADSFLMKILKKVEEFGIISLDVSTFYFVFADDNLLRELNVKYLGIDAPTNVLSFPYEAGDFGSCVFGEVFLSINRLKEESLEYEIPLLDHCCRMIIHGILHICGYDHSNEEEEKIMESKERDIMDSLGIFHTIY